MSWPCKHDGGRIEKEVDFIHLFSATPRKGPNPSDIFVRRVKLVCRECLYSCDVEEECSVVHRDGTLVNL